MKINDLFESHQTCPECGGPAFGDLLLAEKKDACYSKVRSRYKVWPSAYASGALVQCRKKGAANWGNKSKNESVAEDMPVISQSTGTTGQTDTPPRQSFAVKIMADFYDRKPTPKAYEIWQALEAVLPRDYPRVPYQQATGNEPQSRVLADLRDDKFSIVKQNISSQDIAETIASKFEGKGIPAEVIGGGVYEQAIGRKVDANGRTQSEWMQQVKQKFPDAQIVQAKMIDGPAHALLSDGRKIVWSPVKNIAEVGQNFRRGNARRAALNAMSPEELRAHEEKRAEQQRKRDEARLERERQRNAAKKGVAEAGNPAQQAAIAISMKKAGKKPMNEYNGEYDDEAGMARTNLITIARAADGLLDTIDQYEDLPEWVQEKIAKVEQMLVVAWDYLKSQEAQGIDPRITEMYQGLVEDWQRVSHRAELDQEFQLIENIVHSIADRNGVDAETVWEDLDTLSNDELYVFAVTSEPINEDWQKVNKRDKTSGMSPKAVKAYRREHPGSKLQTAVTTKPSKLKRGSKASKRRKSYCSRSRGQMKMHNISCAKTPDKAICAARRRWNC